MTTYRIAVLAAAAALLAVPARTQTAGELLQKGIYTQDTAGDLDGAIAIYRQIVGSGNTPRDIAAQAQYRLAQSLIEKGDLSNGATEFSNLARNYADYSKLISSLAAQASKSVNAVPGGRGSRGGGDIAATEREIEGLKVVIDRLKADGARRTDEARLEFERRVTDLEAALTAPRTETTAMTFDSNIPVTVKGTVFKFQMMNPNSLISIDPMDGSGKRYTFFLASANQVMKQGLSREAIHLGDAVTATGYLATGGQMMPDGTIAASATTITNANGAKIFDRAQVTQ